VSALEAIVLGLVQGLTEFLPISSSAHVRIVPALFGWEDPGAAFTAVIQIGTVAAVLLYFRAELWLIARRMLSSIGDRSFWRTPDHDAKLGWYIVLGTIPISVIGLVFKDQIENEVRSLELISTVMIVFSLVLWQADRVGRREREVEQINARDGWVIGFAQALALIPGVSRSGATISFGLFQGLTRSAAARYSFLLSVPAVVLSGLFEFRHIGDEGNTAGFVPTAIATVVAFDVGYATIAWLLRYVRNHNFTIFVAYRVIVGVIILTLAASGTIN
jgi:undecaprenyl-diphosphatase